MADEDPRALLKLIKQMYKVFEFDPPIAKDFDQDGGVEFFKELHAEFVMKGFDKLPKGMTGLDSGQPWFLYWLTEALQVLNVEGYELSEDLKSRCVSYLSQCQNKKEGGFAGAPYHQSHIASTYAAMLAIVNIGTPEAFDMVDVEGMKRFLLSVKNNHYYEKNGQRSGWNLIDKDGNKITPKGCSDVMASLPGSVEIHQNGEIDMRGVYCSLVAADILNLIDDNPELTCGMGDFIASCQTYEGGITCVPFGEAHGGYTFCGLAALLILNESHKLNLDKLVEWLSNRQLTEEGGFNGRINKLVDSCYNFWQGAAFELIDIALQGTGNVAGEFLHNQEALQGYTIFCCQEGNGGLKDKPMKNPDFYHTMYAASGFSIAQHASDYENLHSAQSDKGANFDGNYKDSLYKSVLLAGVEKNKLRRIHPIYNVRYDFISRAKAYYRDKSKKEVTDLQ